MLYGLGCLLLLSVFLVGEAGAAVRGNETGSRFQRHRVSTFRNTTCAVLDDGTARCWGANEEGQVGIGNRTTPQPSPVSPTGLFGVLSIAAGADHTCSLLLGGALGSSVKCWGDNNWGQLGIGVFDSYRTEPVTVQGLQNVISIAAGNDHACALVVGGTVRCWGRGGFGELGNDDTSNQSLPVPVALSNVIAITAGGNHTCAIVADGTAHCWGSNQFGQLGNGASGSAASKDRPEPVRESGGGSLSGVVAISAGTFHTCALLVDGTGRCWGYNVEGQIGDGTTSALRPFPTQVSELQAAVWISAGSDHSCAVVVTGRVRCWGSNGDGRLGTPDEHLDASVDVPNVANIVEVAAGASHTCALQSNGLGLCWGRNTEGQLGNGITAPSPPPASVSGLTGNIGARGIAAGAGFTCARRGTGTAACWGSDADGRLGNSTAGSSENPGAVFSLANRIMLSAGLGHSCAVDSSGSVRCWGTNGSGQLGTGGTANRQSPGGGADLTNAVAVAAGANHTCALLADGTGRCWGANNDGQLGDGTENTPALTAVQVEGLTGAVAIATGDRFTCALLANGTVQCWGLNDLGRLGVGESPSESNVPLPVSTLGNIVGISAGHSHACAVSAAGTVHCWGFNNSGQLGNTNTQTRATPDTVSSMTDAVSVSAGYFHTCAGRASGRASCWGANSSDELAAEDGDDHHSPTPVVRNFTTVRGVTIANELGSVVGIAASREFATDAHTCALQVNGQPLCWGGNEFGQTSASPSSGDQPRPVTVPSFTANVEPSASLHSNRRVTTIIALVNCEAGGQAHIRVSLTQGSVTGSGADVEQCSGGLARVPIVVPAHGPTGFHAGEATAGLEATIHDRGALIDHQVWTRQIILGTE